MTIIVTGGAGLMEASLDRGWWVIISGEYQGYDEKLYGD